jgi:S-methylmethionine-dependent homocysteine/selenocysteine methylase
MGANMAKFNALNARLNAREVVIIDGGTGTEIPRRKVPLCPDTWSGRANLTHPDVIRQIHEDYISSGAEVIITNTFWTSRSGLKRGNLDDKTVEINNISVTLAKEARENVQSDKEILIAGSMSTFFPMNDPTIIPSYEEALGNYREQAQILAKAGVDFFALEMLIRTMDARAAAQAASETGLPIWVGYSVTESEDGQIYLGLRKHGNESIKDGVEAVQDIEGVSAFCIMHSDVKHTKSALKILRNHTSLPIGAYAHSIEASQDTVQQYEHVVERSVKEYVNYARDWLLAGASIVGGCCGITPDHIEALNNGLPSRLSDI